MVVFPNAKINIGLNVLEKRADGFHNIETVFYPIGWNDVLEAVVDEKARDKKPTGIKLKTTGMETYAPKEKNLCVRAYRLLEKDFPLQPLRMHLHKIVPIGAGLGGGSADAAFAIRLIDKLCSLHLAEDRMHAYAAQLGSDCAFFIANKPAMATGKGDVLTPVNINLDKYYIAVVKPAFHISTAEAYSKIVPAKPDRALSELIRQPIEKWKDTIKNDFEVSAFELYPELKKIKSRLYNLGALYASMSGSGSAMYGIFKAEKDLKAKFPKYITWTGQLKLI